jgi:glucose-6-phosphate-specific signal transduction histidine kinase
VSPRVPGAAGAFASGGHGLLGMRERATLTGSQLTTGPTPGGGWRNELVLPLPDPNTERTSNEWPETND